MNTYSEAQPATKSFSGTIVVALFGSVSTGNDGDGYYFFEKFTNGTTHEFQLRKLDGTSPNFTGTTLTSAFVVFCNTKIIGSDASSHREKTFHMSEYAAESVSALGSIGVPWKEVWIANTATVGADAIKASYHLAQKSVWRPTETHVRDTDHILIAADYAALAGNALWMSDATIGGSHHHDDTIGIATPTGVDLYASLIAYDSLTEASIGTNPTMTQIQSAGGAPQPANSVIYRVPDQDPKISHVIVRVEHTIVGAFGAGMQTLNASYVIAAGSTDPYSGGPGSFSAPAGTVTVSQNPKAIMYHDGTGSAPELRASDVHILPVGTYYYSGGGPSIPGYIYVRYADSGFSGVAGSSRVAIKLIGYVKTR